MEETFGRLVKRLRHACGLTQRELALRACCSQTMLQKIELDSRRPSRDIAERLAQELVPTADERARFLRAARALPSSADPRLSSAAPADPAPPWSALPLPPGPLVGRDADFAVLRRRLLDADTRLLTIVGPHGVGKSTIALWVATSLREIFPDGIVFLSLAALSNPALILPTIAQRLGVADSADEHAPERLMAALRERRMLLVLDTLEHLTSGAPAIVALLAGTRALRVLATSRSRLRVGGEQIYHLGPLGTGQRAADDAPGLCGESPAVALFAARAQAADPSFALTDQNAPTIAAICLGLDGLPFAIELAALWMRLLTPDELLSYLQQHQALLHSGRQDGSAHQHTLNLSIDWSYRLLSAPAQALLARMAAMRGGETLEALVAGCAAAPLSSGELSVTTLLSSLAELAEHSLIVTTHSAAGRSHYMLLETVRRYACEMLEGVAERATSSPVSYFLSITDRAAHDLAGRAQIVSAH